MVVKRLQHWTFALFLGPLLCLSFNAWASRRPFPRRFYMDISSIAFWAEACFFLSVWEVWAGFTSERAELVLFLAWGYLVFTQVDIICCHPGPRHGGGDMGAVHRDPAEGEFCTICAFSLLFRLLLFSSWISLLLACTVLFLISLRWAVPRWN